MFFVKIKFFIKNLVSIMKFYYVCIKQKGISFKVSSQRIFNFCHGIAPQFNIGL